MSEWGYGTLTIKGKSQKAHRYSYKLTNDGIPEEKLVLHKCDVRCCVNPDHLFVGTHSDNVQDSIAKGRYYKQRFIGEDNAQSVLTEKQVLMIRKSSKTHAELSRVYGVHATTIRYIRTRKLWRYL